MRPSVVLGGSNNYHWINYFGSVPLSDVADYEEDFIYQIPDPWDIQLASKSDIFNSYFLNVPQTNIAINPENSRVEDYDQIGSFPNDVTEGDFPEIPAI